MQYPVSLQTFNYFSSPSSPSSPEPNTPVPGNEPKVTKITNCKILKDRKIVEKDSIWIQNGKIIDPHKFFWHQKRLPDEVLDAQGLLVVPGFIETQINGAFGVDFSVPLDHDAYEKALLKVNRGLLKFGTTSYCPTIVSSSAAVYHKVLPHLKPRLGSAATGATILGAHVEGPFISEARIGAHELKVLQASAPNGYKDFKDVYGFEGETPEAQKKLSEQDLQCVKIITCAPELDGVMESIPDLVKAGITVSVETMIPDLVKAGIIVSVGHSMANIFQAEQSVENGATFITHLFNAMPQFHHRDPGVIGLLGSRLDLPRPYYGLICDGIHVHPNSVKIAYDSHPEGVILVTDAMSAMGLAPGNYRLGNMNVTKEEDRVYIEKTDTLAGSVITLDACIRNFIKFTHCSVIEALEAVTLHPAVLLGIQETKGVIKPGADADLVFLSEDLYVKRVFVAGEEVNLNAIDVEAVEKF
ncbi:putative N-acetylglucosamine-6-phosphate deacetylase [Modicella reniformis]|uniref:N-acetylglucosamine-6-phosphate deacetylase n=1 Tax=Modicella reniformis TaxID=1440133 RepID=A0A9P6SNW1_9FUNG|nr:putative N-acetylglucosamine-6-phosphate deacetylase [Modicella reniformis]